MKCPEQGCNGTMEISPNGFDYCVGCGLVLYRHFDKMVFEFSLALIRAGWFAKVERCWDGVPLLVIRERRRENNEENAI